MLSSVNIRNTPRGNDFHSFRVAFLLSVTHRIQAAPQNKISISSPRGVGRSSTEFLARVT